jgi:putative transcriptional regulator
MPARWKMSELMARHKVTGKAMALFLGLSEPTIGRWRNSETMPAIGGDRLEGIAAAISALSKTKVKIKIMDLIEEEDA